MNHKYLRSQLSRRAFVRSGVSAAVMASAIPSHIAKASTFGNSLYSDITGADTIAEYASSEFMKDLVLSAVEKAKSLGASYVDARIVRSVTQNLGTSGLQTDNEELTIGVRVLIDGCWGFAASPYWDIDESVILASEAVNQAKINSVVFPAKVEMGNYPVAQGSWSTPIRIDPFSIPIEEKVDFMRSLERSLPRHVKFRRYGCGFPSGISFSREERVVATSEGSLFSQTLYTSDGGFSVSVDAKEPTRMDKASAIAKGTHPSGAGWELFLDAKLREQIPELIEEAESKLFLPIRPVDVGRYEMVLSAPVMASLIRATLGDATQLDRSIGFEANAGGTTYLGPDPKKHLGSSIGSTLLSVKGDRKMPQGIATVKWDDEGVEPEPFPIISNGVLVDYQTTREQSAWISEWYKSQGREPKSNGCCVAPAADDFPHQHTPNLVMQSGVEDKTFASMVENTKKGIAFIDGGAGSDFQSSSGSAVGMMREIVNGKLGDVLLNAEVLFTSREIWKNLIEIGGAGSKEVIGAASIKGQPSQFTGYNIIAYPGRIKDVTLVDGGRKG